MGMTVQERPDLETTVTVYPAATLAFTHHQYAIYIIGGDQATRLLAYWHMCSSDADFWGMLGVKKRDDP